MTEHLIGLSQDHMAPIIERDFYGYKVFSDGTVLSKFGKPLGAFPRPDGFLTVNMSIEGKHKAYRLHRLMLEAFVGAAPSGCEATHLDGDRSNNSLENLAWIVRKKNARRLWERKHLHVAAPSMDEIFDRSMPEPNSGCWLWTGYISGSGYAVVKYEAKPSIVVSRYVLEKKMGRPINENMYACHTCDQRSCVNPDHLWEGTHLENMHDAIKKGRMIWQKDPEGFVAMRRANRGRRKVA